jgi:hypothetical protein
VEGGVAFAAIALHCRIRRDRIRPVTGILGRIEDSPRKLDGLIRHTGETNTDALVSGSPFATKFETRQTLSVLKVRGEISRQVANGGEFATSMRIRWIDAISDGRETSRSVTAGDLSGPLPSQNRRHTRVSKACRRSPRYLALCDILCGCPRGARLRGS